MSDAPRRPILKLKLAPAPPPPPPPRPKWKCKPCGTVFSLTGLEQPSDEIRCPSCNARLGKAEAFNEAGPDTGEAPRVRARRLPD